MTEQEILEIDCKSQLRRIAIQLLGELSERDAEIAQLKQQRKVLVGFVDVALDAAFAGSISDTRKH